MLLDGNCMITVQDEAKQKVYSTGNDEHDKEWYKDVLRMALVDKILVPGNRLLLALLFIFSVHRVCRFGWS